MAHGRGRKRASAETAAHCQSDAALLLRAAEFYRSGFDDSPQALDCLRRHGLADPALLEPFCCGYCEGRLADILPRDGSGANMYHVKELLGHESLETLRHYARLTITDLKRTHQKCHPRERDAQ